VRKLRISFFGSSLVSAWWNGAATYYRGILRALHERGHEITFYEPDALNRQSHRDIDDPPYARVVVYEATPHGAQQAVERAAGSDLVAKASGVGVLDELLERAVLALKSPRTMVVFWDVDAPATLERMKADPNDGLRALVPQFDAVFTYGGGPGVVRAYAEFGARVCKCIYNALDPSTHYPAAPGSAMCCDVLFVGNRLPDREQRVDEFFIEPARRLPQRQFLLGGNGWDDKQLPFNVRRLGHVFTADHNMLNCSAMAVLNIARDSMARYGYSPATRVFEAAGAGACIITDAWEGLNMFLEPGSEILVARDTEEVISHVRSLNADKAAAIGQAARKHILANHCYSHRAVEFEETLRGNFGGESPCPTGCRSLFADYQLRLPGATAMPPRIAG